MVKVKKLTKQQQKKADKIIELLDELRQKDVYPYIVDGGGGSGISFIRHPREDCFEVGDILLNPRHRQNEKIWDVMYTPDLSDYNTIDYICP